MNLPNGFIQRSTSSATAPIVFNKTNHGGLRLCVDYRTLNTRTIMNRYPFLLILEMLDTLCAARIVTILDLGTAMISSD